VSERTHCTATRNDGGACAVSWGLSPDTQLCLAHDPCRKELAAAARRSGGTAKTGGAAPTKRDGKYRVVPPDAVPRGRPPKTLDDCIQWASWLAFQAVIGGLDGVTVRECNRSLTTLKDSLNKRDLLARIRALEIKLRQYEQDRVA